MDRVVDARASRNLGGPRAAAAEGGRSRASVRFGFLRTIAYTAGFSLCALGVLARLMASPPFVAAGFASGAADKMTMQPRAADPVEERDLPPPPQPAAMVDRARHPDLNSDRLASARQALQGSAGRSPPEGEPAGAGLLGRNRPAVRAAGRPDRARTPPAATAAASPPAPPGVPPREDSAVALRASVAVSPAAAAGEPARPAAVRQTPAACPTCNCEDLMNKRLFTLEPMRREEQAWYRANCPQ